MLDGDFPQATFQHPRIQYFSLPSTIMVYIFDQKRSPFFLIKLYQTCKYFFKMKSILYIPLPASASGKSVYTEKNFKKYNFNKNVLFWFNNELWMSNTCSSVRNRMYYCTLKKLSIYDLVITFAEFEHIISDSIIEDFTLRDSKIIYSKNSFVFLDTILQKLPNCIKLEFDIKYENCFLNKTLEAINEIKFFNKFIELQIYIVAVKKEFDAEILWKFVKQNVADNSKCYVSTVFLEEYYKKKYKKFITEKVADAFYKVFDDWNGKNPKIVF